MEYEVRISKRAETDLRKIYRFVHAGTSRPAESWFLGLRDTIFSLESLPTRGVSAPDNPKLRHLLYGNKPHVYRILYTIDESAKVVSIAQVRHGARKPLQP